MWEGAIPCRTTSSMVWAVRRAQAPPFVITTIWPPPTFKYLPLSMMPWYIWKCMINAVCRVSVVRREIWATQYVMYVSVYVCVWWSDVVRWTARKPLSCCLKGNVRRLATVWHSALTSLRRWLSSWLMLVSCFHLIVYVFSSHMVLAVWFRSVLVLFQFWDIIYLAELPSLKTRRKCNSVSLAELVLSSCKPVT